MTQDTQQESPNDVLAEEIINDLIEAGLIPENRIDELRSKLKTGGASQDDWNLWIELATAPERAEEDNDE